MRLCFRKNCNGIICTLVVVGINECIRNEVVTRSNKIRPSTSLSRDMKLPSVSAKIIDTLIIVGIVNLGIHQQY